MTRSLFAAVALTGLVVLPVSANPPTPAHTLKESRAVLDELAEIPAKGIPPRLLADAQGVAIIPHVVKAGFLFAGRGGHGVVMAREKDGVWGEPTFVHFGGGSVGFQAGIESADVVLIFRHRKGLERVLEGKGKLTLGADVAVAAGPIGREAMAATDARLEAEVVSYSRTRGLFAGVSLDGSALVNDNVDNALFRRDRNAEDHKLAEALRHRLTQMSGVKTVVVPGPVIVGPPVVPVVPVRP